MDPIDVSTLTPEERAQLEAQLAALDAAPGPLAGLSDPAPVNDSATSAPAQTGNATAAQQPAPTSGYNGPAVGETVSHTFNDPYNDDAEVTRYGLVVAQHPADPNVAGAVDRAEIAWLPEGTAVLDVDDLEAL